MENSALFPLPSILRHKPPQIACVGYVRRGRDIFRRFCLSDTGRKIARLFFQKQLAFSNRLTFTIEIYGY